jgi:pyruvate formate lyase activating enzyme
MIGHIHSIETCGTVDGPGMRFVIFFKGCPMRCAYCHNPDTWDPQGGEDHTVEDLLAQYESLKEFYANGGITATGGEPLMQIDFLIELFEEAKKRNIHTCLDTSGIVFNDKNPELLAKFDRLLACTDLIMLDIKHIDPEEHKKLTKQPLDNIIKFARYADAKGNMIRIRHVIVPDITYKPEYLKRLGRFMAELKNVKQLEVLPYHDMGKVKYEKLGIDYPLKDTKALSNADAAEAQHIIMEAMKERRKELEAQE